VFQPNFAAGLTVAVDYFDITIDDTIGGVGADLAYQQLRPDGRSVLLRPDPP
jgi:hypothetical protein